MDAEIVEVRTLFVEAVPELSRPVVAHIGRAGLDPVPRQHTLAHAADGLEQQHGIFARRPGVDLRQFFDATGEALLLNVRLPDKMERRCSSGRFVVGAGKRLRGRWELQWS